MMYNNLCIRSSCDSDNGIVLCVRDHVLDQRMMVSVILALRAWDLVRLGRECDRNPGIEW